MGQLVQLDAGCALLWGPDDGAPVASIDQRHPTAPVVPAGATRRSSTSDGRPSFPRGTTPRLCNWCRRQLVTTRPETRFCGRKCRQSAWRARRLHQVTTSAARPLRFAYADPPYPGFADRLYRDHPDYAGEVDHAELIASLMATYDGWALSTSAKSLSDILPLCPRAARVAAWVKPIGASPLSYGIHNTWEPVIVVEGRRCRPGRRDWLAAQPARLNGDLPGRKPVAFCVWVFELMGMLTGDLLDDLFPGTGIVARTWDELSRAGVGNPPWAVVSADGVNDERRQDPSPAAADDSAIGERLSLRTPTTH